MQRETDGTRLAYVTFKDSQGADTAVLLSGATIADFSVSITLVENYNLPPEAISLRLVNPIACSQLYLYICLSSRKIFTLELLMICECSGIVLTECELVLSYVLMRVMAIHRISDFKNTKCFCFLLFLASTFWNMEFFLVYWLLLLSLERSISEVTLEQMSSLFGSFSILPSKGVTTGMKKKFEHMI
ncbi:uncharacterized protein LOC122304822 [Carya illinoinensis]|uniref:uncharacterized protein LOC122304822 n=1 Tax=Carya illinoinensis TaxID=32201 RepID=UPI001C71F2D5|nr:uncharacterized protein LOC122304822 [Carya illinoinensis]